MSAKKSKRMKRIELPKMLADRRLNPFRADSAAWGDGPQILLSICLRACPFNTMTAWQSRLDEAGRILRKNISKALISAKFEVEAGDGKRRRVEIGLAFTLVEASHPSKNYSSAELHASVGLWLLVATILARRDGDLVRADQMEKQCLWCMPHIFLDSGTTIGVGSERKRRSNSAKPGGDKRATPYRERGAAVVRDYKRGSWDSKNQAAKILSIRHALAYRTARRKLYHI